MMPSYEALENQISALKRENAQLAREKDSLRRAVLAQQEEIRCLASDDADDQAELRLLLSTTRQQLTAACSKWASETAARAALESRIHEARGYVTEAIKDVCLAMDTTTPPHGLTFAHEVLCV